MMSEVSDIFDDSGGGFAFSTQKQVFDVDNCSTEVIVNGSFLDPLPPWQGNVSPIVNDSDSARNTYNKEYPSINKANIPKRTTQSSHINSANSTMSSQDKLNILIIEPEGTEEDIKSFFTNDLKIAKSIDQSILKQLNISNVRKNMSKKLLILEFSLNNDKYIENCLSLTRLGPFNVKVRPPSNLQKSYGIIGPISCEDDLEDLKISLTSRYESLDQVERITKGKSKTETLFLKLTFLSKEMPNFIYLGYQRFPVKTYISTPWQCYKCQGFGHNALNCRFKPRCLVCPGQHQFKDCPHKGNRTNAPICPNC